MTVRQGNSRDRCWFNIAGTESDRETEEVGVGLTLRGQSQTGKLRSRRFLEVGVGLTL